MDRKRPNPVRWLWYALGGTLPEIHRGWVLHDLTARTWVLRHAARTTIILLPLLIGPLFLPGPLWIRLCMVLLAVVVGHFYSVAYMAESREHRLRKHGFPPGAHTTVVHTARAQREELERQRYLAVYRPHEATTPADHPDSS